MINLYDIKLRLTPAGEVNFLIDSSEEVEDMKAKIPNYAMVEERLIKDIEDTVKIYAANVQRISNGKEII